MTIDGATGILLNLTGGRNMSLNDVHQASTQIQEAADEDAEIIFGAVIDETMEVTIPIPADGPSLGVAPSGT